MPANKIQRIPPAQMPDFATAALDVLNGPEGPAYPITAEARQRLSGTRDALVEANEALFAAECAYRAAVDRRLQAHAECGDALAHMARAVNAAELEAGLVAALGLSPRKATRSAVVPRSVGGLVAAPSALGEVTLTFDRKGNAREVIFVVEAQIGSGPWTMVACGTRTRYALRGFPPGVPALFRVAATKGARCATPCPPVPIYAGSLPDLAVAA